MLVKDNMYSGTKKYTAYSNGGIFNQLGYDNYIEPPEPPVESFLLIENGGYMLIGNGGRLKI